MALFGKAAMPAMLITLRRLEHSPKIISWLQVLFLTENWSEPGVVVHLAPLCGAVKAREAMIAAEKRLQLIQEALREKNE